MTFQPTTPAEARAAVAFTRSGSISAAMDRAERLRRDRDCILCEMAVARLWKEERIRAKKANDAMIRNDTSRAYLWVEHQAKAKASVIAALKSGAQTTAEIMAITGHSDTGTRNTLRRMIAEGLVDSVRRKRNKTSMQMYWLKDDAE